MGHLEAEIVALELVNAMIGYVASATAETLLVALPASNAMYPRAQIPLKSMTMLAKEGKGSLAVANLAAAREPVATRVRTWVVAVVVLVPILQVRPNPISKTPSW